MIWLLTAVVVVLVCWCTYLTLLRVQDHETTEQTADEAHTARGDAAQARAEVRAVIDHLHGTQPATGRHARRAASPSPRQARP